MAVPHSGVPSAALPLPDAAIDALSANSARFKGVPWHDPVAYGAANDGVTDDLTILQEAADAAGADGLLRLSGDYLISDTLVILGAVDAVNATLNYTGSGTALRIRSGSGSDAIHRRQMVLPAVIQGNHLEGSWDSSVGVEVVNANACEITVPHVQGFGTGLRLTADAAGHAYNTYNLGHLDNNKVNLQIDPGSTGGWVNENTFLGGRASINSGEGIGIIGARHILISAGANQANNNRFFGTSIEGNSPEYHVECYGQANYFIALRWEATTPKINFAESGGVGANSNVVFHGYNSQNITATESAVSQQNHIYHRNSMRLEGSGNSGVVTGANLVSSDSPVFVALPSGDGVAADATTRYGFRAGHNKVEVKATADTGARLLVTNNSGRLTWGDGAGGLDVNIYRGGANRLSTDDDLFVTGLVSTKVVAGPVSDTAFLGVASNGALGVDSTNGRIYFRYGGAWHYVAQTAGFQIPEHEKSCPNCGREMAAGERVVGRIESKMTDGALHGLWEHMECPNG